jgi:glycosyltransferase involved in cell wall biosynthesis
MNSEVSSDIAKENSIYLSIVIPAFNEGEGIRQTLNEVISNVPKKITNKFEIVVVDDGSTDQTLLELQEMCTSNSSIRVIAMRGNQGHMAAITAGLTAAKGDWILTMDADLQDPPALIGSMIQKAQETDCDVVQAVRISRDTDSGFKRITSDLYYRWMRYLLGSKSINQGADFRLISREVRDEILSLPEKSKVFRLLIPHLGFKIQTVEFARGERAFGATKYPISRMISLAIDSTVSFSSKPLRSLTVIGGSVSILMFVLSIFTALARLFIPTVSGWTSIVCLILAGNALILASIGVLGEYISKIFVQVQNRPEASWDEVDKENFGRVIEGRQLSTVHTSDNILVNKKTTFSFISPFLGGIFGLIVCIWTFGWDYLSPYKWEWAQNSTSGLLDVATSVAAQQDFFNAPWRFPMGLVENYGFPVGSSLIQTATVLIPAALLKIFATIFGISAPLQSAGLTFLIGYFFLGVILFKLLMLEGFSRRSAFLGLIPFFFIPKLFNSWTGPSLSWAWLLPMSIYLYRSSLEKNKNVRMILWGSVGFIAASTHTYFLVPIIVIAFFMSLEMYKLTRNYIDELRVLGSLLLGVTVGTWLVGGFNIGFDGSTTSAADVGPYASDLLGLFITYDQSRFFPSLGHLPSYEGHAYLGLGLLISVALALTILFREKLTKTILKNPAKEFGLGTKKLLRMRGLVISSLILTIFAIGPTIPIAGEAHPIKLPSSLLVELSIFRASGRFVWLGMFLLAIYSLVFIHKMTSKKIFQWVLPIIVVIQVSDTTAAIENIRLQVKSNIVSSETRLPYIDGNDVYFLPGYQDPRTTPWQGQVFQTLQKGSKVYFFSYQGRYSPKKIGDSVIESVAAVKAPNFNARDVIFVKQDYYGELLVNLQTTKHKFEVIQVNDLWTAIRILKSPE